MCNRIFSGNFPSATAFFGDDSQSTSKTFPGSSSEASQKPGLLVKIRGFFAGCDSETDVPSGDDDAEQTDSRMATGVLTPNEPFPKRMKHSDIPGTSSSENFPALTDSSESDSNEDNQDSSSPT